MFIELTLKSEQEEYVREVREGGREGGRKGEREDGEEKRRRGTKGGKGSLVPRPSLAPAFDHLKNWSRGRPWNEVREGWEEEKEEEREGRKVKKGRKKKGW